METREYKEYTIKVEQDTDPESPRECDNLGTMVCFHNRYILGDKHDFDIDELKEFVARKDVISLPLYLYDHSGVWMRTNRSYPFNCPWDSGQVGYIYVTKYQLRKEYSVKRITKDIINKAINVMVQEVEMYSQYISGNVWGFCIENPEGEMVESVWGYYDIDEMIAECEGIIDYDLDKRLQERTEATLVEVC
jgi:hypothetical protein